MVILTEILSKNFGDLNANPDALQLHKTIKFSNLKMVESLPTLNYLFGHIINFFWEKLRELIFLAKILYDPGHF